MPLLIPLAIVVIILISLGVSASFAGDNPFTTGGILGNVFDEIIAQWAQVRTNLDTTEIKASIQTESSGNPNASNPGDPSWGLMGVTSLIAKYYLTYEEFSSGLWKTDPNLNIKAGSGFLSDLKTRYEDRYPLSDPNNGWIQTYNVGETKFNKGIRNPGYQSTWMKWQATFYQQERGA